MCQHALLVPKSMLRSIASSTHTGPSQAEVLHVHSRWHSTRPHNAPRCPNYFFWALMSPKLL